MASILVLCCQVVAQEKLDSIFDRGYVAEWLVCGPFDPDVDAGIVSAVKNGDVPLGTTDFMKSIGGIARMKPKHVTKVTKPDGQAFWEETRLEDESLDLSPFFPDASEGISYAAFYTQCTVETEAYIDLQTTLGARVFLNGFPVREVRPVPITQAGADRFITKFRAGSNLMVFEVPGATYAALAKAFGTSTARLKRNAFRNRPLLRGKSGFEMALRVLPVARMDGLVYVPQLKNTGTFSGSASNLYQDVQFTLFNPQPVPSAAFNLRTTVPGVKETPVQTVPGLEPGSQYLATLSIPVGASAPGSSLPVDVTFESGGQATSFNAAVNVLQPPSGGKVYFVTGNYVTSEGTTDQAEDTDKRIAALERQMFLLGKDPFYGFDLGCTEDWKPWVGRNYEKRQAAQSAVLTTRCASHAGYSTPDERIVCGELLARNLAYGYYSSEGILGTPGDCYYAWHTPGMCPQSPQLLAEADVSGVVSNLQAGGIPELFRYEALNGTRVMYRHKRNSEGPGTVDSLRKLVWIQRRELMDRNLTTDLYVNESVGTPPEPFFMGASEALADSFPSIEISGNGASEFFEEARDRFPDGSGTLPVTARTLNSYQPGSLVSQPNLKHVHAEVENQILTAEKFATIAALLGAIYPEAALDKAWRQLLFWSKHDRLGFADSMGMYIDAMAGEHEAAGLANDVLQRSMSYIADQVNTYAEVPIRANATTALVIFNPSSRDRTDIVNVYVPFDRADGITILDEKGAKVPFMANNIQISNTRIMGARLHFIASDMPSLGYRTYYIVPAGTIPRVSSEKGAYIENEFYTLMVDASLGGAIVSLIEKKSGEELVGSLLNDFVALTEDTSKNDSGRDLWTTGDVKRASEIPAEVRVHKTDWMQNLTITLPLDGGVVVREITLYKGIPYIDCAVRTRDLSRNDRIYALTFDTESDNRVPIFGERFGALVGRKSLGKLDFRTQGSDNPSGTGVQPALRWVATSPNDYLRFGPDIAVPLGPAAVVYDRNGAFRNIALEVQSALISRGIPCSVWPDMTRRLNPIWTDSTEFPNHNDDLVHGTAMRIVLGGPEYNIFSRRIFTQLPSDVIADFNERMIKGDMLFCYDYDVPDGHPPVPTLLVAAHTLNTTMELIQSFADSIDSRGFFELRPEAYIPLEGTPQPKSGLAIFHKGTALASLENDGTLALLLGHGSKFMDPSPYNDDVVTHGSFRFRYAIYPFAGSWRGAGVPHLAKSFNEPMVGTTTRLHTAKLPSRHSFINVSDDAFIVTAVKPAGYRVASMKSDSAHPRNGMIVRGYDSTGHGAGVTLSLTSGLRDAMGSDVLDRQGPPLASTEDRMVFSTNGFDIRSLYLMPSSTRIGDEALLWAPKQDAGPVFSRYWKHNEGPAPMGFQPLSINIEGDLTESNIAVQVSVTNNLGDKPLAGNVEIRSPEQWRVSPETFAYDLTPGSTLTQEVVVLRESGSEDNGGLIARTQLAGQTIQDIMIAEGASLEMDVERSGQQIIVIVKNKAAIAAEGHVYLIAPHIYWPELGSPSGTTIMPARAAVTIPPFQEQRLVFYVIGELPDGNIAAKLAANGKTIYHKVQ